MKHESKKMGDAYDFNDQSFEEAKFRHTINGGMNIERDIQDSPFKQGGRNNKSKNIATTV